MQKNARTIDIFRPNRYNKAGEFCPGFFDGQTQFATEIHAGNSLTFRRNGLMTKSTTRRFLCCLLALCCLLGSLTAFSLAAGTSYPYSASVNADTNLRRSPSSAESNIIARIPKGTILTVTGASGNFLCVTYDGQVGYIFKQYAEQVTTNTSESGSVAYGFPYYTTTKSSVNLRTTRSTTSARVTTIPKGATVIIHGVSGDWAQVTYQEKWATA